MSAITREVARQIEAKRVEEIRLQLEAIRLQEDQKNNKENENTQNMQMEFSTPPHSPRAKTVEELDVEKKGNREAEKIANAALNEQARQANRMHQLQAHLTPYTIATGTTNVSTITATATTSSSPTIPSVFIATSAVTTTAAGTAS